VGTDRHSQRRERSRTADRARAPGGVPGERAPAAILTPPPPPAFRDPWAWASVLAVLPLLAHALGAPLGEPVAEDFDFLHRALFARTHTLLDGGGSMAFWRPLSHQVYYLTLGRLALDHPSWVAAINTLLLALTALLLYRALRPAWPGPWCAAIASFPLLSESTRMLISWPSHFVDLGVWLFTALAFHEAAARRLWTTLVALLAALLCKEVAVVTAVLVPFVPGAGPRDRPERARWIAAIGLLVAAWGAAYLAIRHRAGLALPHHLETSAETVGTPIPLRVLWAVLNSLRALFSLPATPTAWEGPVVAAGVVLLAATLALALGRRVRQRMRRALPLGAWGFAWFAGASATMAPIFPYWAPARSGFGGPGFGALAAALLGAAHPALLAALVALRLVAFALSPAPPAGVPPQSPQTGAFMDFEQLVRLQRLMRETRTALQTKFPALPPRSLVGLYYLPRHAQYSFGGSQSLQAWYRDSTLHWVTYSEFIAHPDTPLVTIAEFDETGDRHIALVEPAAMRSLQGAFSDIGRDDWAAALRKIDRADSIQRDPAALVFAGQIAGMRATVLVFLGRHEAGEREAHRGCLLWPANSYARFALGYLAFLRGRLDEAAAQVDTILGTDPNNVSGHRLGEAILKRMGAADSAQGARPIGRR
jgi:hypothetical protein